MSLNRLYMNRGFWALLLLFFPTYIFSQNTLEKTWLWQVSGGELEGKSFLFGTVPSQDSTFFQFNDKVWKSLSKSDVYASFAENDNPFYQSYYENSFGKYEKHYGVLPSAYLKQTVQQEFKPVVTLNGESSYQSIFSTSRPSSYKTITEEQKERLKEAYLSANHEEFVDLRKQLDVPEQVYQVLQSKNNYLVINDLIDKMRLQPVFIAVDAIYLTGEEGLVNLLKARGFQLKPIGVKEYEKVAAQLEQQRLMKEAWLQANQPSTAPTNTPVNPVPANTDVIAPPTTVTQNVKLDLPMGILNLSQWSDYELAEGKYQYTAPQKLKSTEISGRYATNSGGISYQVDVVEKWENVSKIIEKIIIQNGGQLVKEDNYQKNGISGKLVELMYAESQISKHLLLQGVDNGLILTVKGETPAIHTVLADKFLQSFQLDQVAVSPSGIQLPPILSGGKEQESPEVPLQTLWKFEKLEALNFSIPDELEKVESTTADGKMVKAVISSKVLDNNTFVVVVSEKEAFDNFRLFNTSINTAAAEVRGVVVERKVMPEGRNNFAEYLVKDSVGNFYRIQYLHKEGKLYQIIAKGDKKSVYNENAERLFQSVIIY